MKLQVVDFSNYKLAIEIQKQIFPDEDGTINIFASLDRDLFIKLSGMDYLDDHVKYYLAYDNDLLVGITGLYNYQSDYEVWIAWYGILSKYRKQGYGRKVLEETLNLARNLGYKVIRLYTDKDDNKEAIRLYEKVGFIGEKYLEEKLDYNCYIYSKSLYDDVSPIWEKRKLGLAYQSELDHMDNDKIIELLNKYDNLDRS